MNSIQEATQLYENWLGTRIKLIPEDLELKHKNMASGRFPFLRATFYRWMQLWPQICPELAKAPTVLAVGDLHVENFGTWRDAEGRLVWGVNDFDEAYPLPYTVDLVRLAASARLAIEEESLSLDPDDACESILDGYADALAKGSQPFVLGQRHVWLRDLAQGRLRDPEVFWGKMDKVPDLKEPVPGEVTAMLEKWLPEPGLAYRVIHRIAGLGSLGRPRYVALAEWRGSQVAREAKALDISACLLGSGNAVESPIYYQAILRQALRATDPLVSPAGSWLVRRLAPDCSRIELASLPEDRDESRLLTAMGRETANVHLGDVAAARKINADLKDRPSAWLSHAARDMTHAISDDWQAWKKSYNGG
jgi:hypothetical protein